MYLKWPIIIIIFVIVCCAIVISKSVNETFEVVLFKSMNVGGVVSGGYGLGSYRTITSPPTRVTTDIMDGRIDKNLSVSRLKAYPDRLMCVAPPQASGTPPRTWGCDLYITFMFPNQANRNVDNNTLVSGSSSLLGVTATTQLVRQHLGASDSHMTASVVGGSFAQMQIALRIPDREHTTLSKYVMAYDTLAFMMSVIQKVQHLQLDVMMLLTHDATLVLSRYKYTHATKTITQEPF
jgi:hypothetical protein